MDKLKSKILLVFLIMILLCSVQAIAAQNSEDVSLTSENVDLSICDDENNVGQGLRATNTEDILTADEHPFSELQGLIDATSPGDTLELEHDYILTDADSTLVIPHELTIDGKGYTLNGNNLSAILFTKSKITLQNINFINANCTKEFYIDGTVVYGGVNLVRGSDGSVIDNCIFKDNVAVFGGGVYWSGNDGKLTNSVFENNIAMHEDPDRTSQGGAVNWRGNNGHIENCKFNGNSAKYSGGAIYIQQANNHVIINSSFSKNIDERYGAGAGGAVYYYASLNAIIENSNFTENVASGSGGAVYIDKNSKNLSIIDSLFTNNSAKGLSGNGVAPSHGYGGGAVFWIGSDGRIENSNFTDNTANIAGAVYYKDSSNHEITGSSFSNNTATMTGISTTQTASPGGGAIYSQTVNNVLIENSNFTENSAFAGGAVYFNKGKNISIESSSFSKNAANDTSLSSPDGGAIMLNTITDATIENVNFTENFAKHYGGAIYNYKGAGNQLITGSTFFNNTANNAGAVEFDTTNNALIVNSNFTENSAKTSSGGAVFFTKSSNGVIDNSKFIENSAGANGGAVAYASSSHNQKITDSTFSNNTANYGGAVHFGSSNNCIIEGSEFSENSAKTSGGAVYYTGSNYQTITGSKFNKNTANGTTSSAGAGAVYYTSSKHGRIEDSEFNENVAAKLGGAVCYYGNGNTNQTITGSNFTNNAAKGSTSSNGGAVYWGSPDGTIKNSEFSDNSAQGSGGAICLNSANNHLITGSTFSNNAVNGSTSSNGGAVFYTSGKITNARIDKSEFTDNTARGYGGAVYYYSNANSVNQSITDSNFTGNIASTYDGGAVYCAIPNATVSNCNFNENSAKRSGGAIYYNKNANNQLITGSTFLDNTANGTGSNGGGAIYYGASNNQKIEDSKFNGNNATTGSAIYHNSGSLDILSTELLENQAHASSLAANAEVNTFDVTIHTEFKGRDNILNGIYSMIPADVKFTDVTYWGADGKMNTGDSPVTPVASADASNDGELVYTDAREAGINITVSIYDENGVFIKNITATTNIYGDINFTEVRFTPGKYRAVAIHKNDKYYTEISKEFIFEVPKANSTIMAENQTVVYNSDVILNTEGENATGINASSVIVLDSNGNPVTGATVTVDGFKITISGLIPGKYIVRYNNTVDETYYNTANNVTGVTVLKANSTIMAENQTVVYNSDVVLEAEGENATGINASSVVVLDSNGNPVTGATVTVDGFKITISGLIPGNYTVKYNNTVNETLYNQANNITGVTVLKANSTIKAENQTVVYNSDVVLNAEGENATGIDPVSVVVLDSNGNPVTGATVTVDGFKITISGLIPGNYTVKYNNAVDETYYNTANNVTGVTVLKANSTIKAENQTVVYNSDVVLNAEGENATGIDSASVVVLDSNGNQVTGATVTVDGFKITISGLIPGNYTVKYNNTQDEALYNPANNLTGVTVLKANSTIKAENKTVVYNATVVLLAEGENATGIDAASVAVLDADGNEVTTATVVVDGFSITIGNLGAGNYSVKYNNTVDETLYNPANNVTGVTVLKAPSTVSAENVVATFGDEISISVSSVNATNITYEIVDSNNNVVATGTVGPEGPINASGLVAGNYVVKLTTVVDNNHTSVSSNSGIHVRHVYFITIDPVIGYTREIVDITAHVTDETGKPVDGGTVVLTIKYSNKIGASDTLSADGELLALPLSGDYALGASDQTYSTTVSNGEAVFTGVKLGAPGVYPDVGVYTGDDGDPAQNESTVTVLKLDTKPSADDVSGKEGDKVDIPVKIVDQNGQPVKNGTATLVVDGKSYTADVVDGIALFKNVALPADDTVAEVYYHGNDYYNDSNSTFLITIEPNNNNGNNSNNNVTPVNGTGKFAGHPVMIEAGNPIALLLIALITLVSDRLYRKR